ncbi:EVE domain-containing protein [Parahaliea aestuarii]|uniref:EVE domain-containing protein n=1 Tax=Parahaliea aestuarii TaxID=1852021 RepID=A0A5C8ZNX2_9GAMM|nr:EVE domain-containing protein [Parahaliea aestuarii]TXS89935.1 EVE domain-containing protein [Parahaliea aestuarii]
MNYWLLKTEPDEYSLDDLRSEPSGQARWDGIRNYQARNLLRDAVQQGDQVLIYHSQCRPVGVAGTAEVVRAGYPDPAQFDPQSHYFDARASQEAPRWYCIDIRFVSAFPHTVTLADIKSEPALEDMVLRRQGRLSVQPVSPQEWRHVHAMAGGGK